jgi:hypothetical protein
MLNAMSFTKILKIFAGKLCTIIRDDSVWYAKTHYYAPQNLTIYSLVILLTGSASTHLVKVSIATIKKL